MALLKLTDDEIDALKAFVKDNPELGLIRPTVSQPYGDAAPEDLLWQGRWLTVERLRSPDFLLALGWWDGAFEIWLGRIVIRFQGYPGDYR